MIDIRYFFNPEICRKELKKPFNFQGRTIAGDGARIISVPELDEYEELSKEGLAAMTGLIKFLGCLDKEHDFLPLPEDFKFPEPKKCATCRGQGKAFREACRECEGEGSLEFYTPQNNYSPTCKTCDGDGTLIFRGGTADCPVCNGTAVGFLERYYPVHVYEFKVNALLLHPLKDLDARFAVTEDRLIFRCGEAKGLIMGMR